MSIFDGSKKKIKKVCKLYIYLLYLYYNCTIILNIDQLLNKNKNIIFNNKF